MDAHFDCKAAAQTLEQLAAVNIDTQDRRLSHILQEGEMIDDKFNIVEFRKPSKTWRLTFPPTAGTIADADTLEECVFKMRGVIAAKKLPPITRKVTYNDIRQELIIHGLETPTFNQAIDNVHKICNFFDREIGEDSIDFSQLFKCLEGDTPNAIEVANRLFTPIQNAGHNPTSVPFEKGVDPKGCLAARVSEGELIHMEENSVSYYKLRNGNSGSMQFEPVEPKIFRIGDIVEVQISFMATPLQSGRRKMRAILRTVALLDGSFAKEAIKKRTEATKMTDEIAPTRNLKRKAGYAAEPDAKRFTRGDKGLIDLRGVDVEMESLSVTATGSNSNKTKVD